MRKTCFIVFAIFVASIFIGGCASGKVEDRPLWTDSYTVGQVFPSEKYVTGIGKGASRDVAVSLADGNLASYFSREISSSVSAQQVISNAENSKNQEELVRNVTVKSEVALAGVNHTDVWFDKKQKEYYCCSYLDRAQAWKNYESTAAQEKSKFYSFLNSAEDKELEKDPFKKIEVLKSAKTQGEEYQKVILFSEILYKQGCASYSKDRDVIAAVDQKISDTAMNISMTPVYYTNSKHYISNNYSSIINKLITDAGFKVDDKNQYSVNVSVFDGKEKVDDVIVSIPEIKIEIKNDRTTYLSYSTVLEKMTVFAEAEKLLDNKIYKAVEKALKEDFASQLATLK